EPDRIDVHRRSAAAGLVEIGGKTDNGAAPRSREARLAGVGSGAPGSVVSETANLAREDVDRDDFLPIRMPRRDRVGRIRGTAIEGVGAVLGRGEGPIPEGPARRRGD